MMFSNSGARSHGYHKATSLVLSCSVLQEVERQRLSNISGGWPRPTLCPVRVSLSSQLVSDYKSGNPGRLILNLLGRIWQNISPGRMSIFLPRQVRHNGVVGCNTAK